MIQTVRRRTPRADHGRERGRKERCTAIHENSARAQSLITSLRSVSGNALESELFDIEGAFRGRERKRRGLFRRRRAARFRRDWKHELAMQVELYGAAGRESAPLGSKRRAGRGCAGDRGDNKDLEKAMRPRSSEIWLPLSVVRFTCRPLRERRRRNSAAGAHFWSSSANHGEADSGV